DKQITRDSSIWHSHTVRLAVSLRYTRCPQPLVSSTVPCARSVCYQVDSDGFPRCPPDIPASPRCCGSG
ncbi:hypothetical protein Hamer_G009705, partial [Homarus americanus]